MTSLEKLASYFDSFSPGDPNYDYVCFLRQKLAGAETPQKDITPTGTEALHEEDNDEAREVETAEGDKTQENLEGKLMEPAFQDLEVLNQIEAEKKQKQASANPVRTFLEKISKKG